MFDFPDADATSLRDLIVRREASVEEVVGAAIERAEQVNASLNAIVTPLYERALAAARSADADLAAGRPTGLLHGVPIVIKDLFDFQAGVRNTFGCRAMADFVPTETSAHIARLVDAGAIVIGKTNTPEFGHKGVTDNRLFGPTSTPFDLSRNAGGSSGGSAAAVAAGIVPLAQGSDAGGSVRIPAAWCGVVGFKATFGRIANTGGSNAFACHSPFVHAGPLARTVRDAALMLQAMVGPHPRDPFSTCRDGADFLSEAQQSIAGKRIGFSADWGVFAVDPEMATAAEQATAALAEAGAHVEQAHIALPCSQDELAQLWRRQVGILYADMFATLRATGRDLLGDFADDVPEDVHTLAEQGQRMGALEIMADQRLRTEIYHAIQDRLDEFDFLATPTLSCRPVKNARDGCTLGPAEVGGKTMERGIGWCLTHPLNFTGHPAAAVPAGLLSDGLPASLQVVGRRFEDGAVLAVCAALEKRRPWIETLRFAL